MTATEKLRAMLDERGVEHFDGTEMTLWGYEPTGNGTGVYRIMADEVAKGRLVVRMLFKTPEQAIEATLGKGECEVVSSTDMTDVYDYIPTSYWRFLMSCGCDFDWMDRYPPFYCPCCGRKVKE